MWVPHAPIAKSFIRSAISKSHLLMETGGFRIVSEPRRAVSYGPVPLKTQGNGMMQDDWMVQAAKPMWGKRGRDVARLRGPARIRPRTSRS